MDRYLETLRSLVEEMKCPVCHRLLDSPVETNCRHAVCFTCAQSLMDQSPMPSCVVCTKPVKLQDYVPCGPALRGALQRLRKVPELFNAPPVTATPIRHNNQEANANSMLVDDDDDDDLDDTGREGAGSSYFDSTKGSQSNVHFTLGKSPAYGRRRPTTNRAQSQPPVFSPEKQQVPITPGGGQNQHHAPQAQAAGNVSPHSPQPSTSEGYSRHMIDQTMLAEQGSREQLHAEEQLAWRRLEAMERAQQKKRSGGLARRGPPGTPGGTSEKPETSRKLKVEGDSLYEKADYATAIHAYTRALALNDGTSKAHVIHGNRSAAHYMMHNYAECTADCLRAVLEEENNSKLYQRAAKAEANLGNFARALEFYEKAQQSAAKKEVAFNCDTEVARMKRGLSESDRVAEIQRAGKYDEAYAAYINLNTDFPETIRFRINAAECLVLADKAPRAVEDVKRLLGQFGHSSLKEPLAYLLGKALYYCGFDEFKQALDALHNVEETLPEAKVLIDKIQAVDKLKTQGNELFQARQWKEAVQYYTQALDKDPSNRQINKILYCNRAAAYKEIGQFRLAISDCTKAIEIDKVFLKAYTRRARCFSALEEWENACNDFNKALEIDPKDTNLMSERTAAEAKRLKETSYRSHQHRPHSSSNAHQTSSNTNSNYTNAYNSNTAHHSHSQGPQGHNSYTAPPPQQPQPQASAPRPPTQAGPADFYTCLGLTRTCTEKDVKIKFRELSLRYHPDKCVSLPEADKKESERMFKVISEAYGVLSDSGKRRDYDLKLDRDLRRDMFTSFAANTSGGSFSYAPSFRARTGSAYW